MDVLKEAFNMLSKESFFWGFLILCIFALIRRKSLVQRDIQIDGKWWRWFLGGLGILLVFFVFYKLGFTISFLFTAGLFITILGLLLGVIDGLKILFKRR